MADFASLVVQLELQQAEFLKGMEQAANAITRTSNEAKKSQDALTGLSSGFEKIVGKVKAAGEAFGAWKTIEAIATAGEKIARLEAQFASMTGSGARAADIMARIEDIASDTHAPADQVADSMRRVALALTDLGATNAQMGALVSNVQKLGQLGGSGPEQIAATTARIAQALQLGTFNARSFKEMLADTPEVVREVAKQLGLSTVQLNNLAKEGKLTGEAFANGLLKATKETDERFRLLPVTFTAGTVAMSNGLDNFLASFDKASGAGRILGETFRSIGATLTAWGKQLEDPAQRLGTLQTLARGLKVLLEAVAVISANVVFVFSAISDEIVALGQTAAAVLSGEWALIQKIHDDLRAKNAVDRAALDAFEARILGIGNAADKAKKKIEDLGDPLKGGKGAGAGSDKAGDALKARADAIAASVNPTFAYNQAMKELNELMDKGLISSLNAALAMVKYKDTLNATGDAIRASVDPTFVYEQQMKKLNAAYASGAIEVETWVKAQEKAKKELDDSGKAGKFDWAKGIETTVKTSADAMGDFFGAIVTGSMSAQQAFQRMAESILSAIAKLLAEAAAAYIVKVLFSSPGATASAGANAAAAPASWAMGAASWAPSASMLATGPVALEGGVGEATAGVIKPTPFKVEIHNYAGAAVSTEQDSDGALKVIIERVRRVMTSDVSRGGNPFAGALERTYALGRGN